MALDAHLNLAIFIFLSIVISFTNGFELSNQAKFSINDQIHKRFVDSILYSDKAANLKQPFNLSVASANLKRLQNGLVRKRNAECLIEMHSRLSDALFVLDAHNFSSYAQNNDQNLTMKILNELDNKCIDSESLIQLFVGRENTERDFRNLISILLVESLENKGCDLCQQPQFDCRIKKSQSWFYGLIFVSIINTSSLCGAFVIPLTKKKFYKKVLMFMIGIAVGTLAGSGFLHLIPEAFGIDVDIKYAYENGYIYKGLVMMGGVYLFFLVERIMTLFILKREIPVNESSLNLKARKSICSNHKNDTSRKNHGHSHAIDFHSIAPVAWMIICGDGLHNFIDGLGIGAAFTKSIYQGINISFAVACEEFPHELGDFAILINAGMSYSTALLMNFVSACCCYVGLVAGIMLEEFSAGTWIYALAGGMFLYISLCNMIPELNEMGDEIEKDYKRELMMKRLEERKANKQPSKNEQNSVEMTTEENGFVEFSDEIDSSSDLVKFRLKILFIQNLGVLSGFFVMLILAVFRDYIKIFTEDNC